MDKKTQQFFLLLRLLSRFQTLVTVLCFPRPASPSSPSLFQPRLPLPPANRTVVSTLLSHIFLVKLSSSYFRLHTRMTTFKHHMFDELFIPPHRETVSVDHHLLHPPNQRRKQILSSFILFFEQPANPSHVTFSC